MSLVHIQGRDEMKTCPYDKSHRVTALKFTNHIIKCRRNHQGKLIACPFNATHLIPPAESSAHVATCPDRLVVERELVFNQTIGDYQHGGNTEVPPYNHDLPEPSENWELEVNDRYSFSTYDPSLAMSQVQFRNPSTLSGMKPAQKKAFRKDCWAQLGGLDKKAANAEGEEVSGVTTQLKQLRLPKQLPKTVFEKPSVSGIGRGRRIAANIYSEDERPVVNQRDFANYLNFAVGRGMKSRQRDEQSDPGTSASSGRISVASTVSMDRSNYEDAKVCHVRNRLEGFHLTKGHETEVDHIGRRFKDINLDKSH